jgi:hypothetical protein
VAGDEETGGGGRIDIGHVSHNAMNISVDRGHERKSSLDVMLSLAKKVLDSLAVTLVLSFLYIVVLFLMKNS